MSCDFYGSDDDVHVFRSVDSRTSQVAMVDVATCAHLSDVLPLAAAMEPSRLELERASKDAQVSDRETDLRFQGDETLRAPPGTNFKFEVTTLHVSNAKPEEVCNSVLLFFRSRSGVTVRKVRHVPL